MRADATKSAGTDPVMFDIEALFDAAKRLNTVADHARLCGWEIEIDGADNVVVKAARLQTGDAR